MKFYKLKFYDDSEDEVQANSIADAKEKGRKLNDCGVRSAILLEDDLDDEDLDDEEDESEDDEEPAPSKRKR